MDKLKPGAQVIRKGRLYYTIDSGNRPMQFRPWLADSLSFLYDAIMKYSVFPKKFGGDIQKHYQILAHELAGVHGKQALELAAGSGSAIHFLAGDNRYTGTDISPRLLEITARRFIDAGFSEPEFYVTSAVDLPFANSSFDLCLCILSLNFIGDAGAVFRETRRVLTARGVFVCSVPVPERNRLQSTIRGVLHSQAKLEEICTAHGFAFEPIPAENGALLYFKAARQD